MSTPRTLAIVAVAVFALRLAACDKSQPPATTTPTPPADDTAGTPTEPLPTAECKPTGCSGTVCSDEEVMTTCEFRPEYACYKTATCGRQADGSCGWTKSAELDACLANPPPEK